MRVLVHKSAFWVLLKGQNTKMLRFFALLVSQGHTIFGEFFFHLCEKKLKNHGYKNAKKNRYSFFGQKSAF